MGADVLSLAVLKHEVELAHVVGPVVRATDGGTIRPIRMDELQGMDVGKLPANDSGLAADRAARSFSARPVQSGRLVEGEFAARPLIEKKQAKTECGAKHGDGERVHDGRSTEVEANHEKRYERADTLEHAGDPYRAESDHGSGCRVDLHPSATRAR